MIAVTDLPVRRPPAGVGQADVASSELGSALAGADAVVHVAWLFHPTHDPAVTWRNNVVGSLTGGVGESDDVDSPSRRRAGATTTRAGA